MRGREAVIACSKQALEHGSAKRQSQVAPSRLRYRGAEPSKCRCQCTQWSHSASNIRCSRKMCRCAVGHRPWLHYETCTCHRDGSPTPKARPSAGTARCQRYWGQRRPASAAGAALRRKGGLCSGLCSMGPCAARREAPDREGTPRQRSDKHRLPQFRRSVWS